LRYGLFHIMVAIHFDQEFSQLGWVGNQMCSNWFKCAFVRTLE